MSANSVEKNAQKLNAYLRSHGKKQGKSWRLKIRALLSQTFEALNAKPIDGALCLELAGKIEREIASLESGEAKSEEDGGADYPSSELHESRVNNQKEAARIALGNSAASSRIAIGKSDEGETRVESKQFETTALCLGESSTLTKPNPDSVAGDTSPENPPKEKSAGEIGLFDLIHIQIRCFFKLNACTRPPYIGKFVRYADKYGEVVQERVNRFIRVLSKNEDEFAAKLETEVGYDEDLLPDMPERGLVLHPRKKKKR